MNTMLHFYNIWDYCSVEVEDENSAFFSTIKTKGCYIVFYDVQHRNLC